MLAQRVCCAEENEANGDGPHPDGKVCFTQTLWQNDLYLFILFQLICHHPDPQLQFRHLLVSGGSH